MYRVFEERGKKKRKKKKNTRQCRLVTFYRLYGRKIKLMERREEGGLTEKEKARNEEERVTRARAIDSFRNQFYYRVIKKKGKKKGKRVRERIEGYFASLHFTDLLISANLAINLLPGFGCKSVG